MNNNVNKTVRKILFVISATIFSSFTLATTIYHISIEDVANSMTATTIMISTTLTNESQKKGLGKPCFMLSTMI